MLRIKLIRSTVGYQWRTRRVVESLGLRKINSIVEHDDTAVIRGMIHRVKELLHVEEVEGNLLQRKPLLLNRKRRLQRRRRQR